MLVAQNISHNYPEHFSLKEISLQLKAGEIVAVIGQSGSGKTTLLHLVAGLKDPGNGDLCLDGEKLLNPAKKLIPGYEKIKLVKQQNTLFPNIRIHENIAYELKYYTKEYQEKRIKKLSKQLNISKLLEKFPRELSGGELQRVMIAAALADEPKVLLLDEPMANLDRIHKKTIMLELLRLTKSEGIACMMVTHDIFDAFGMAGRLLILKNGQKVQEGNSEEIYFKPKNRYVAELFGEVNLLVENGIKLHFRPEDVKLLKGGKLQGIVKEVLFQGSFYELHIQTGNQCIICHNNHKIKVGEKVNFEICRLIQIG